MLRSNSGYEKGKPKKTYTRGEKIGRVVGGIGGSIGGGLAGGAVSAPTGPGAIAGTNRLADKKGRDAFKRWASWSKYIATRIGYKFLNFLPK